MNDEFAILTAKTEYREAYNNANVDRLLAVSAPEFTGLSISNSLRDYALRSRSLTADSLTTTPAQLSCFSAQRNLVYA